MSFSLSKNDRTTRNDIVDDLRKAGEELEDKISEANEAIGNFREEIEELVKVYNDALGKAVEMRDRIVSVSQEDFDNRSEKWQEGEKGEAARQFIDEWEALDLDDIAESSVWEFALPDVGHADELENCPVEA